MILVKYLEEINKWYNKIHTDKGWASIQIIKQIEEKLGLNFVPEPFDGACIEPSRNAKGDIGNVCMANSPEVRDDYKETFATIDLLDYIYAVLHSPSYRETYKECLKLDFSLMPYPKDQQAFWYLVRLGEELRQLHLLESPKMEDFITSYPKDGSNKITTKISKADWEVASPNPSQGGALGRIWINDTQYFDNIPLTAWEFYIGGYQPAQKWLKDHCGQTLDFENILHYQKIIVALTETIRLMQKIDGIEIG
nr:adenine specific DNA methyltransferase [uncultured bacterium]